MSYTGLVERPSAAIDALTNGQRQIDTHGESVGVSRQALDETLAYLDAIEALTRPVDVEAVVKLFESVQGYKGDEHVVMAKLALAAMEAPHADG